MAPDDAKPSEAEPPVPPQPPSTRFGQSAESADAPQRRLKQNSSEHLRQEVLLAVDLGVRTGLSCFTRDGRIRWVRSRNFGSRGRLRAAVTSMLKPDEQLVWLVLEGEARLADAWRRLATQEGASVLTVSAETWREQLLRPSERRDGATAKAAAGRVAREAITWSGLSQPATLRHDAAEAVLIGIWGLMQVGWLDRWPPK